MILLVVLVVFSMGYVNPSPTEFQTLERPNSNPVPGFHSNDSSAEIFHEGTRDRHVDKIKGTNKGIRGLSSVGSCCPICAGRGRGGGWNYWGLGEMSCAGRQWLSQPPRQGGTGREHSRLSFLPRSSLLWVPPLGQCQLGTSHQGSI